MTPPSLPQPAGFLTVHGACVVYSRAETRRLIGLRHRSVVACETTELIDNGNRVPDRVTFETVVVLDRHGAYVCHVRVATGPAGTELLPDSDCSEQQLPWLP